jgi:hypothetical protein
VFDCIDDDIDYRVIAASANGTDVIEDTQFEGLDPDWMSDTVIVFESAAGDEAANETSTTCTRSM